MARLIDLTAWPVAEVLPLLLADQTTKKTIVDGEGNPYVVPEDLQPRITKSLDQQSERTRKNAEVFTPAWICCQMNNFCDEEWFDGPCPFNTLEGETWKVKPEPVPFRTRCGWQKYIYSPRLEITCGEAPFLVSRYCAATGHVIPLRDRIGILDRKLRVVGENTQTEEEWFRWAKNAFKSVYGFELQADNLLIARINLLLTFVDYLAFRWNRLATLDELKEIAEILCWNLWQMDGLDGSVPFVFEEIIEKKQAGFDWWEEQKPPTIRLKTPCKVRDWRQKFITEFMPFSMSGGKKMKFDFVIGNPPYQETMEGTSDRPVYNDFMDAAYQVADKVELITPARFLFNAGKTPKAWNEKMLADPHLKVLAYKPDSSEVFRETNIMGGIVITYRDTTKNFGAIETFTLFEELNSILVKVLNHKSFENICAIIYQQSKFVLDELYKEHPEYRGIIGSDGTEKRLTTKIFEQLNVFTETKESSTQIGVFGLLKNNRVTRFIEKKFIVNSKNCETFKVLVPASNGSAALGKGLTPVIGNPVIGEPNTGYTQSFIGIGLFTKEEAEAALKYIKSKFARCMIGTLKVTQHNHIDAWANLPLQDFTSTSDIDWTVSVSAIDAQLYQKYGLSPEEIAFIETNVKEME